MYFGQEGQDKFLDTRVFRGFRNGTFVEVGAHDGKSFSNTRFFEEQRDWRGLLIEPNPAVFGLLTKNRPLARHEQCAISETDGVVDFLEIKGESEMLSGIVSAYDPRHKQRIDHEVTHTDGSTRVIQVQSKPFASVALLHNLTRIHYMSIDVEGAEHSVVRSIDFDRVFIDVIGFEANYTDTTLPIIAFLNSKGYRIVHHPCVDVFMIHSKSPFAVHL